VTYVGILKKSVATDILKERLVQKYRASREWHGRGM